MFPPLNNNTFTKTYDFVWGAVSFLIYSFICGSFETDGLVIEVETTSIPGESGNKCVGQRTEQTPIRT